MGILSLLNLVSHSGRRHPQEMSRASLIGNQPWQRSPSQVPHRHPRPMDLPQIDDTLLFSKLLVPDIEFAQLLIYRRDHVGRSLEGVRIVLSNDPDSAAEVYSPALRVVEVEQEQGLAGAELDGDDGSCQGFKGLQLFHGEEFDLGVFRAVHVS